MFRDKSKKNLLSTIFRLPPTTYHLPPTTQGQSLLEVLIALVVGSIFIVGAATIIVPSLRLNTQANRIQVGAALGKELLENVRVSSEADWHTIYNLSKEPTQYHLTTSTSPFAAAKDHEIIVVSTTTYTRYFSLDNVGRDAGGNIISSGGTDDPSTQKVTVVYSWSNGPSNTIVTYLTRFRNNAFVQTDWSGGPGQDGPATTTNSRFSTYSQIDYATTTGSIIIKFP